jgi:hypothetical protein
MNILIILTLVLIICFFSLSYSSFSSSSSDLSITFFIDPGFLPNSATPTPSGIITFDSVSTPVYDSTSGVHTATATIDINKSQNVSINVPLGGGIFISTPSVGDNKPCVYYYDYQTLLNIVFVEGNIIKINSIYSNTPTIGNEPDYSTYIKSVQNLNSNRIGTLSDQYLNTNSLYGIEQILRKWYYKSFEFNTDGDNFPITIQTSTNKKPYIKVINSINNQMNGRLNLNYSPIEYQMYHVNNTNAVTCNFLIPKTGGILIYTTIPTATGDENTRSNFTYYSYNDLNRTSIIQFNTSTNIPNRS